MCIICIDIEKNLLSHLEARRNLGEMIYSLDSNHIKVVQDKISELIEHEAEEYEQESCEICGCESCECDWSTVE